MSLFENGDFAVGMVELLECVGAGAEDEDSHCVEVVTGSMVQGLDEQGKTNSIAETAYHTSIQHPRVS